MAEVYFASAGVLGTSVSRSAIERQVMADIRRVNAMGLPCKVKRAHLTHIRE